MNENLLDCAAWKAMLDREDIPATDAFVGVVTREGFAQRRGKFLVWRGTAEGAEALLRDLHGEFDGDVAMLLVADDDALQAVLAEGLGGIRPMVRSGRLHPYMLATLDEIEDAGLSDFVEDLGLVFPRH